MSQMGQEHRRGVYLERVNIDNFGRFNGRSVGTFRPGLNIVSGPNEAGKSTISQFVEQVLYGWQRAKANTNDYKPNAGERVGNLIFSDGVGRWSLERAKGNTTNVRTIDGEPWPGMEHDLTGAVSDTTYKDVFSFNADKLNDIGRGSEGITAALLTAGSGTREAPALVLEKIEKRLSDITGSSKTNPDALGTLSKNIDATGERIAMLEKEAAAHEEENLELVSSAQILTDLKTKAAKLESRAAHIDLDAHDLSDLLEEHGVLSTKLDSAKNDYDLKSRKLEAAELSPDARLVLKNETAVLAAQGRLGDLRSALDRNEERRAEEERLEAVLSGMETSGCMTEPTIRQSIIERKSQREGLVTARRIADEQVASLSAKAAGLKAQQDALEARPVPMSGNRAQLIIGIILAIVGVVGMIGGVLTSSMMALILSAVLLVAGIVNIVLGVPRKKNAALQEERDAFEAQSLAFTEEQARTDRAAFLAAKQLSDFDAETARFLQDSMLGRAQGNLDVALQMMESEADVASKRREYETAHERLTKTSDELAAIVSTIKEGLAPVEKSVDGMEPSELLAYIPALHQRYLDARKYAEEESQISRDTAQAKSEKKSLSSQNKELKAKIEDILARNGLTDERTAGENLAAQADDLRTQLAAVNDEIAAINTRVGELRAGLDEAAKTRELEELRQQHASLLARREKSAHTYLELMAARELMRRTIASWEGDRQPEVFRTAGDLLSQMTDGAWTRVSVEGDEVFATGADYRKLPSYKLSCGTCQQLYLALRIALLLQADGVGAGLPVIADDILVNFDATRREGAARALARLAQQRQVILFTCHSDTEALLEQVCPTANIFNLGA